MGQPHAVGGHDVRSFRVPGVTDWYQRWLSKPFRWRWRWLIIPLCGALGLTAGILWALLAPMTYTATGYAFVALTPRSGDDPNYQDPFIGGKFALQRTATYAGLATSADVLKAVAADTHRGSVEQLRSQIEAIAVPDRVILRLSVHDADPQAAAQIANSVMDNLGRTVGSLELGGHTSSLELGNDLHASPPVQIVPVQPALVGGHSPRRYKALAGLLAGLTIGITVVYLMARFGRDSRERHRLLSQPGPKASARQ